MLLLKLALRPWRLAPLSQLFSAAAVGFLLLLAGMLFWLQQGLTPVLARIQQEQVVTAYLQSSIEAKDEGRVVDEIKLALGAHAERSDIQLVRSDQFIARIKKNYPDLGRELEDLGAEMPAVVPRYVSVSGLLIDSALERIRAVPGIESAESSKDRNRSVLGAFAALRWVAKVLSVGLCLALFTGLIHLARTNSYIHRDAVALLKLLGSGGAALQAPGILSGLCVGALGGAIALSSWLTGGIWLSQQVTNLSPLLRDLPAASPGYGVMLFCIGSGIGLLAGIFGCLAPATRVASGKER